MLPRWIILGLLLAGIVCGTIVWWPERPMWTKKFSKFSQELAFSEDSNSIYVLDENRNDVNEPIKSHLSRWDTLNGKLLNETLIELPAAIEFFEYKISHDKTSLMVIDSRIRREWEISRDVFYVIDTASGKKRLGPIEGRNPVFSPTGLWIAYSFKLDVKNPLGEDDKGIEIIDSKTGKKVLRVAQPGEMSVNDTCFSPDGSSIALLQQKFGTLVDYSIRIIDLSEGKVRCQFPLKKRDWESLHKWEDHQLIAFAHVPNPNKRERISKCFAVDLNSLPPGQETERPELEERLNEEIADQNEPIRSPWHEIERGSEWSAEMEAQIGEFESAWLWRYWNKCAEWIGAKKN